MSEKIPTTADWQRLVDELTIQLQEARAHLKVARKADDRRREGPLLPCIDEPQGEEV